MNAILSSSIMFGIALGYIQGTMDPENSRYIWKIIDGFTRELEYSELFGVYLGTITAVTIEIIR